MYINNPYCARDKNLNSLIMRNKNHKNKYIVRNDKELIPGNVPSKSCFNNTVGILCLLSNKTENYYQFEGYAKITRPHDKGDNHSKTLEGNTSASWE